jgi:hypothetical protein
MTFDEQMASIERNLKRYKVFGESWGVYEPPSSNVIRIADLIAYDEAAYVPKEGEVWVTLENGTHVVIEHKTGVIAFGLPEEYIGLTIKELGEAKQKEAEIDELTTAAKTKDNTNKKVSLGKVDGRLSRDLSNLGFDLEGYTHEIDTQGIRHIFTEHGDPKKEIPRGQVAIADDDIKKLPYIISSYDTVRLAGKTHRGLDVIEYRKKINGTIVYLEEIRTGKKTLTTKTMWKFKR